MMFFCQRVRFRLCFVKFKTCARNYSFFFLFFFGGVPGYIFEVVVFSNTTRIKVPFKFPMSGYSEIFTSLYHTRNPVINDSMCICFLLWYPGKHVHHGYKWCWCHLCAAWRMLRIFLWGVLTMVESAYSCGRRCMLACRVCVRGGK